MLSEFIAAHQGKYLEVAGSANAKNQCVDLVNAYLRDVLDHPIVEWTNAADFPSKITKFPFIKYSGSVVPRSGSIIVWGKPWGKYISGGITYYAGHIAIVKQADSSSFTSFDQNYPVGAPCQLVKHTYSGVLGWFDVPLEEKETMTKLIQFLGISDEDAAIRTLTEHLGVKDGRCDWGSDESNRGGHLGAERRKNKKLQDQITQLSKEVDSAYQKGLADGKQTTSPTSPPQIEGWEVNGLQVSEGSKTWNYRKK